MDVEHGDRSGWSRFALSYNEEVDDSRLSSQWNMIVCVRGHIVVFCLFCVGSEGN